MTGLKNRVTWCLAVLIGAGMLLGCGGEQAPKDTKELTKKQKAELFFKMMAAVAEAEKNRPPKNLAEAFRKKNLDAIKAFVAKGAGLKKEHLEQAVKSGEVAILDYLLSRGLRFDFKTYPYCAYHAGCSGSLEMLKRVEALGAPLDCTDYFNGGNTMFHIAASVGNTEMIQYLLDKGLDKFAGEKKGKIPYVSLMHRRVRLLRIDPKAVALLKPEGQALAKAERFIDIDVLAAAINLNRLDWFKDLVPSKFDVDYAMEDHRKRTLLSRVVSLRREKLVKYLIEQGADITKPSDRDGNPAIYKAISRSSLPLVKLLTPNKTALAVRGEYGYGPIHWAVKAKGKASKEVLEYLLAQGVDVNTKSTGGQTALCYAIQNKNPEAINVLLAKQAKMGGALKAAARAGNIELAKRLIAAGANVKDSPEASEAVIAALSTSKVAFAKFLLESGVSVGHEDWQEMLVEVAGLKSTEALELVLAQKVDPNQIVITKIVRKFGDKERVYTKIRLALVEAVKKKNLPAVKLLVEAGAKLNPDMGKTGLEPPYYFAVWMGGKFEMLDYFFSKGLLLDAPMYRNTLLGRCASDGNLGAVKFLVSKGAKINQKSKYGQTPLCSALWRRNASISIYLLAQGADVHQVAFDGNTPLHVAAEYGTHSVVEFLLKKGAKKGVKNKAGQTPYDIAKKYSAKRSPKIIDLLAP